MQTCYLIFQQILAEFSIHQKAVNYNLFPSTSVSLLLLLIYGPNRNMQNTPQHRPDFILMVLIL